MEKKQPLVSVNVLMYNSSKYILETLESIKTQTYQNIELIMSDDKSTDNTVQICEKWIAKNKDRFASYQILVPDHNTGQSGNYNRAFRAATGEWIKEIDGDDLLQPNCLTNLMEFVKANPEAKYVFGKLEIFGGSKQLRDLYAKVFIYDFFNWSKEKQLEQLIFKRNCIPSQCAFYNKAYVTELGFENDERIPYMEDHPKWIKLIQNGVKFYFCDKILAKYRLGSGISTLDDCGMTFYKTNRLLDMYYLYPEWEKKDKEYAINRIVDEMCASYQKYLTLKHSRRMQIANILFKPMDIVVELINKMFS
jgi:alpha-1,3-rhamnosyltransferase